jgi:hypothetical protein
MNLELVGTIKSAQGTLAGQDVWVALIDSHPSLGRQPPRQGINPFTKAPITLKGAPDHALVKLNELQIGSIHWAMDGSPQLLVWALPEERVKVISVALDVSAQLGGQFIPATDA